MHWNARKTDHPLEPRFPESGVVAMESRHSRNFRMPPKVHGYLKALFVFSGNGEIRGAHWSLPLAAGDVALIPPGHEHWISDRRPLSLYVVCFRLETYPEGCRNLIGKSGNPRILREPGGQLLEITRRLLHEQSAGRPAGEVMARGLAWEMLALLARAPVAEDSGKTVGDVTGSRARVARSAEDLRHRFYEPLRLEEEARRAGLGRRRFSQLFREVNGMTWWEALNLARLGHAERLLRETDRSVTAVAFECGYGDLSVFYRAWGAKHRENPQKWRSASRLASG